MRDKIVSIALEEVGYIEKESDKDLDSKTANPGNKDYTKYGKWFGSNPGPWCCKFICWVFNKAGCLNLIKKTAGCGTLLNFFKNKKEFHERTYKPNKADIIFINWDKKTSPQHVGIVINVTKDKVYTVEGNRGNEVKKCSYSKTDKRIIGYGTPAFKEESLGDYIVTAKAYLHVRSGPGTNYSIKKYEELTCNERLQDQELIHKKCNGLAKGVICNVTEIKGNWGKIDSGWICLDYCKKK